MIGKERKHWNIWTNVHNRYVRAAITIVLLIAICVTYYPILVIASAIKGAFQGACDEIAYSLRGGFTGRDWAVAWRAITLKDKK